MDFVSVSHCKLKVEDVTTKISSLACSAVSLFVGVNVDNYDNQKHVYVEYDADIQDAEMIYRNICQQVREKWKVQNIAIYHRLGIVPIQEASIIIAVSSPDISESMQALQYVVCVNKERSPVTKKDVVQVKDEYECDVKEELLQSTNLSSDTDTQHLTADMVPLRLIQIKADSKEINRRINCFIERKREQANIGNVQEFRQCKQIAGEEDTCARVDALLLRRKDSKSHLRVRRVFNSWGPHTRSVECFGQQPSDESSSKQDQNYNSEDIKPLGVKKLTALNGVEERLSNAEEHLQICGPVPKDVYARLKQIENRILYLESLSPEYFHFLENVFHKETSANSGSVEKKRYSQTDLNNKLQELEFKLASKMK
ncbi:molybdopterin synthase catalytic subunit [Anabrus simplex]|uniref:molybdopterin synthase catalytic subunit n=1 Tax=Anabrus simplex TaxID=316456 RepID=UPI0034DD414C